MGSSVKTLCDWKIAWFTARFGEFRAIVAEPQYLCRKCGRVANEEKWLCKPMGLNALIGVRPKKK